MTTSRPLAAASILAQGGPYLDRASGAVVPPIQSATTFARDDGYLTALGLPLIFADGFESGDISARANTVP